MVLDISANFMDEEQVDKFREKATNRREKAVRWMRIHPKISLLTGVLIIGLFVYSVIPLGFLYFLPDFVVKQIVYACVAGIVGFYFGRRLYRRNGIPQTEIVKEINIAQTPMVQRYRHLRGDFKDDFEFVNGRPIEERRDDGIPVYNVIRLDFEEKKAYCSPLGDMPQAKLFETKEAIKAQFMYNDQLRKFGAEINMKMEQIVSQVQHNVANAFIRKLETVAHPEDLIDASKDGIPTQNLDIDTPDLDDIIDDKVEMEKPNDLEPVNQPENS